MDDARSREPTATQPHLDGLTDAALTLSQADSRADDPIPFALTARGRRIVAPDAAPALQLVDGNAEPVVEDELDDPRSVQARALRRAGMPLHAIAARLGVDAFTVRAWLGGRAVPGPAVVPEAPGSAVAVHDEDARTSFDERIDRDPAFAGGIAALGAIGDIDGAAVVLVDDRPAVLAQALDLLRREFGLAPERIRVVLRLGAAVAGDRAVSDWSQVLGIAADRVRSVRSGRVPVPDGIEVLVRVTGPEIAAVVATWQRQHQLAWRPSPHASTGESAS